MMIDSETDGPPVEAPGFLRRAVARVSSAINLVALAVLALMSLLIVADVIGRYCFLRPITRSYEMVGLLTLIVVGLGLPYATMRLGHLKVGWVLSRFPSRAQSVISGIWDVLGLGVFSLITWQSVMLAEGLRPEAAAAATPAIPGFVFWYVFAFGSAVLCLVLALRVIRSAAAVFRGRRRLSCVGLLALAVVVVTLFTMPFWGQSWLPGGCYTIGVVGLCLLFALFFSGMPAAVAMVVVGILGIVCISGVDAGLHALRDASYSAVGSYAFAVVPLFLLMAAFIQRSGIAQSVHIAAGSWLGRRPGGPALSTIVASVLNSFAQVSGQSNAATAGAAVLPRLRGEQHRRQVAGSVGAGGAIAILVPPGIGFLIYAIIAQTSIIRLFLAGLLPAILVGIAFVLYVLIAASLKKSPPGDSWEPPQRRSGLGLIVLLPLSIWVMPMAGMFMGVVTPVEAAAVAALLAFVLALAWSPVSGRPIISVLRGSLLQAVHTSCVVGLLLTGAAVFVHFIALTALPAALAGFVGGLTLSLPVITVIVLLLYGLLSYFIEPLALMVVSLPFLLPVAEVLDFDMLWFGVALMLTIGIAMLLSPFYVNVRIAQLNNRNVSAGRLLSQGAPYAMIMVVALGLLLASPQIALWLPGLVAR